MHIMQSVRSLLSGLQQCRNISGQIRTPLVSRNISKLLLPIIQTNQTQTFAKDCKFIRITPTLRTMASSSSKPENMVVEHDPSGKKFFIKLGQEEAKLEYTTRGDTWNMWHTEVPPALQGKGIAKVLAKGAFDHAVKNNLKMRLTCPYLQKYYADNPKDEYTKLVVKE